MWKKPIDELDRVNTENLGQRFGSIFVIARMPNKTSECSSLALL